MSELKFGLPSSTVESLTAVFAKRPLIEKVILYGSRAMGTQRPNSDIDLTLVGTHLTLTDLLNIETEIDDLLMPYKVDLSIRDQIDNINLLTHIERHGVVFYERH